MANIGDIEIVNMALPRLGRPTINSFNDDTEEARAVRSCFFILKKDLVGSLNWSFFADVLPLALAEKDAVDTNYSQLSYKYVLPKDFIKIESIIEKKEDGSIIYLEDESYYEIIGNFVYTDVVDAGIKFISSNPTAGYSASFAVALASRLSEWLMPTFGDPSTDLQQLETSKSIRYDKSARSRDARNKSDKFRKTLRPYGRR